MCTAEQYRLSQSRNSNSWLLPFRTVHVPRYVVHRVKRHTSNEWNRRSHDNGSIFISTMPSILFRFLIQKKTTIRRRTSDKWTTTIWLKEQDLNQSKNQTEQIETERKKSTNLLLTLCHSWINLGQTWQF